jgi:hypothetical protein
MSRGIAATEVQSLATAGANAETSAAAFEGFADKSAAAQAKKTTAQSALGNLQSSAQAVAQAVLK